MGELDYKKMWNKLKNYVDHKRNVYKRLSKKALEEAEAETKAADGMIVEHYYQAMCQANVYSGASQTDNNTWKEMRRLEREFKEKQS